ncbi:hypothetical protein CYMTET_32797 [Cymbomonas tetramitiformis]|uniref:Uncharacterized protein n=1 Tax=Cymbomonas tetramitiformis TaxID=36881 RepID=A0AAE0KRU8_9CHLO|nr:hypothetical protein CYMTET_32797 [Cymbomonas tetramitiformis]|eukprot:gene8190-9728_t
MSEPVGECPKLDEQPQMAQETTTIKEPVHPIADGTSCGFLVTAPRHKHSAANEAIYLLTAFCTQGTGNQDTRSCFEEVVLPDVSGCEFIKLNTEKCAEIGCEVSPSKIGFELMGSLDSSKGPCERWNATKDIARLLPVERICARVDKHDTLKDFIAHRFPETLEDPSAPPPKFSVQYEEHSTGALHVEHDVQAKIIADMVPAIYPVDIRNPEYTILVIDVSNMCMMSVVKDWNKLYHYNVNMLGRVHQLAGYRLPAEIDESVNMQ